MLPGRTSDSSGISSPWSSTGAETLGRTIIDEICVDNGQTLGKRKAIVIPVAGTCRGNLGRICTGSSGSLIILMDYYLSTKLIKRFIPTKCIFKYCVFLLLSTLSYLSNDTEVHDKDLGIQVMFQPGRQLRKAILATQAKNIMY